MSGVWGWAVSGAKPVEPICSRDAVWHDLMCQLDDIREYLDEQNRLSMALVIGDVQSRLTKQKETIASYFQNDKVAGEDPSSDLLKPCPFCGSTASRMRMGGEDYDAIYCDEVDCGASVEGDDYAGSVRLWNRRQTTERTGSPRDATGSETSQ